MKWGFFKFDKSRWIIFIISFLIFPVYNQYQSSQITPMMQADGPYPFFIALYKVIVNKENYYLFTISIIFLILNLLTSYILSYHLTLLYKKIFKKSSR